VPDFGGLQCLVQGLGSDGRFIYLYSRADLPKFASNNRSMREIPRYRGTRWRRTGWLITSPEPDRGDTMNRLKILGIAAIVFAAVPRSALSQILQPPDPRIADLVHAGKLRIGVFPSFQYSKDSATGQRRGLAIEIANCSRLVLASEKW
jgi:hypothetical protein